MSREVLVSAFSVGSALEHDHHAIDGEFERFMEGLERGEWLREAFERGAEGLRHHIFVEEEVFFPFLRVGGLVAPVFVMLREHAEIWRALETVEDAMGQDRERAREGMATLASALEQHNLKEEQVLYPRAVTLLSESDAEAVRAAFEEQQRPDGWVPTNLRR